MNLPTVAIILEEHSLIKIYGASRIVHLVNTKISNPEHHITAEMTGKQITALYKSLDYTEQMQLVELDVFDDKETDILINQIELLNNATNSEGQMSETLRGLMVAFTATVLVIIALAICVGYYENARQNNAVVDSKLFSAASAILNKLTI